MPQTGLVPFTPELEDMIGTWGTEQGAAFIVKKRGEQLEIIGSPNDTWRAEISDAKVTGSSVTFIKRNYLHDGAPHPFNGHACECVIEMEDGFLKFRITNTKDPELAEYLIKLD